MATRGNRLQELVRRRQAERQRALREPDFFEDRTGIHPIRDSPGYSTLREREESRHQEHERSREDYERKTTAADAERSYRELQREILAEGGIKPTRDYPAVDIPQDVRRHGGKPPDLMAATLEGRGHHYQDGDSLLASLKRRRRLLEGLGRLKRA